MRARITTFSLSFSFSCTSVDSDKQEPSIAPSCPYPPSFCTFTQRYTAPNAGSPDPGLDQVPVYDPPQAQRGMRNSDPNTLLHHLPVRANVDGHLTGTIITCSFYPTKIYKGDTIRRSCPVCSTPLGCGQRRAQTFLFKTLTNLTLVLLAVMHLHV